jgi:phosphatidylglycerophosphate synthase
MKDKLVSKIRDLMYKLAVYLNKIANGKLKPSHITFISVLGHMPVAWALVTCRPVLAAVLLAIFSLLDALDGALARVQNSASLSGMYMDAVSDRLKEVIVYSALAVMVVNHYGYEWAWLVVAVAGTSLLVSYTKAKGEMAVANENLDKQKLNRIFGGGLSGLASYEVRVVALVISLLFGVVIYVLFILLIANLYTSYIRYNNVSKQLKELDKKAQQ